MTDRVLLCATDAGGAANVAPLVPALTRRGLMPRVVTRPGLQHLFAIPPEQFAPAEADPEALLAAEQPRAVICGTTCYDSIDRRIVPHARARGIRSTAVVDERYEYAARFVVEGRPAWPDAITVLDAASIEEAERDGVPAGLCHATGSPALAQLAANARARAHQPPLRPPSLQHLPDWPLVVFISETIADDYGTGEPGGPLGPFAGFTEHSVRAAVLDSLGASTPLVVIDKLHPASRAPEQPPMHVNESVLLVSLKREPLWPLLCAAHVAVGMQSIGLLEAALLGVPAVSFQPGGRGPERATAVRLGLVPRMTTREELAEWCEPRLKGAPWRHEAPDLPSARPDAAERVLDVALRERDS